MERSTIQLLAKRGKSQRAIARELGCSCTTVARAWNVQLAARALGIGSVLTTVHRVRAAELKAVLGIPEQVEPFACVPMGYPQGQFGTGPREPAAVAMVSAGSGSRRSKRPRAHSRR